MKNHYHDLLVYIYENDEAGIREISKVMARRHKDHRDFYGLVALLQGGYIGFTGPIVPEPLHQAHLFQCYSQGKGHQRSGVVELLPTENIDSYFYLGAKGIEYFHQRSEARKSWYIVAILSLVASIVSGVFVAKFTDDGVKCCPQVPQIEKKVLPSKEPPKKQPEAALTTRSRPTPQASPEPRP